MEVLFAFILAIIYLAICFIASQVFTALAIGIIKLFLTLKEKREGRAG